MTAACGHDPAQFVTADEGTSYCPACEDEARSAACVCGHTEAQHGDLGCTGYAEDQDGYDMGCGCDKFETDEPSAARLSQLPSKKWRKLRERQRNEALRLALLALEMHPAWCGFNKDAPGDPIYYNALREVRVALGKPV